MVEPPSFPELDSLPDPKAHCILNNRLVMAKSVPCQLNIVRNDLSRHDRPLRSQRLSVLSCHSDSVIFTHRPKQPPSPLSSFQRSADIYWVTVPETDDNWSDCWQAVSHAVQTATPSLRPLLIQWSSLPWASVETALLIAELVIVKTFITASGFVVSPPGCCWQACLAQLFIFNHNYIPQNVLQFYWQSLSLYNLVTWYVLYFHSVIIYHNKLGLLHIGYACVIDCCTVWCLTAVVFVCVCVWDNFLLNLCLFSPQYSPQSKTRLSPLRWPSKNAGFHGY